MTIKKKKYKLIFDQCLSCGGRNVRPEPFRHTIGNTIVEDLPHVYCEDCGDYTTSSEFEDPVASVLALLDICPKTITMDQIRAADRHGYIKF